jgi:decaprenyl-phosphate phosphoribosyltransferase
VPAALRLLRPRQWIKNLLVFAAPGAAGVLDEAAMVARTSVVALAFCLAASGTYCLNDAADVEADRLHPTKANRPVASGQVTPTAARVLGVGLLLASLVAAGTTGSMATVGIVALYVATTTAYTHWLKHVAVVDLMVVAAGFVIRALAGAVGTDIPVSEWYLIVASFGSLFLVAGKRASELDLGADAERHRRALGEYSASFLLLVKAMAAGVTLLAYCLWAFERAGLADGGFPWFELSIVPCTAALLRFALAQESSEHAGPEDIVLGDRPLQVLGILWAALLAGGVYVLGAPPVGG